MKIIAKKNWVYCVLLENDEQILSVPFGDGSVDFSRAFKIPLVSLDEDYLEGLAKDVRTNYEKFKPLEVTHP